MPRNWKLLIRGKSALEDYNLATTTIAQRNAKDVSMRASIMAELPSGKSARKARRLLRETIETISKGRSLTNS